MYCEMDDGQSQTLPERWFWSWLKGRHLRVQGRRACLAARDGRALVGRLEGSRSRLESSRAIALDIQTRPGGATDVGGGLSRRLTGGRACPLNVNLTVPIAARSGRQSGRHTHAAAPSCPRCRWLETQPGGRPAPPSFLVQPIKLSSGRVTKYGQSLPLELPVHLSIPPRAVFLRSLVHPCLDHALLYRYK
jgi:hypothetical protein